MCRWEVAVKEIVAAIVKM